MNPTERDRDKEDLIVAALGMLVLFIMGFVPGISALMLLWMDLW